MTDFDASGVIFDALLGFDGAGISQNILLSGGNLVDQATLSGGATVSGLPLSNIQTTEMWQFARFSSLVSANTYLLFEYVDTQLFQLIGTLKHNMSSVATWRVRIADTVAEIDSGPSYDSGVVKVAAHFTGYGTLDWGEWEWGGVLPDQYSNVLNKNAWLVLSEEVEGKVVRIDYDDELENEDGYIQIARIWLNDIYQPSVNVPYGAKINLIDKVKVREAESGVRYYGKRYLRRMLTVSFDLPMDELYFSIFGPYYVYGGQPAEIVAILQPLKPEAFLFEAVYGNLRESGEVTHPSWKHLTATMTIDERV